MSSLRLFPLKLRYVRVVNMLLLLLSAAAKWLTPFELSPQWDKFKCTKPLLSRDTQPDK